MSTRFLLEAKNIIKTFPPTVALNDVHFCLRPGEIHGLMGENGSGKSTMCSIVSGIYPYDSGELFLDGEPYCPKNMIDAAAKGVCMIVQEQGTFASTTVAENIFIGKEKQFHNGIRLDTKKMANAAQKILDELQMQHIDARMTCGRLSFEDRKLVEIARAMYSDPKVLIIDETTSALSKNGRDILYGLMEKMKAYKLQEDGMDTVDANICLGNFADERDYGVGAQILRELGIHKMRLMTNNPVKRVGLEAYGLEIVENVGIETVPNPYNERYLKTKKERMGHTLHFNK